MMQLITPEVYGEFLDDFSDKHRLRYHVSRQCLDRDVEISGDVEVDEFDVLRPVHLLNRSIDGCVQGRILLLPSTGPIMLREPRSDRIWRAAGSPSMLRRMRRRRAADLLRQLTSVCRHA
ncbi:MULTISPECIES: acyl-homoserine-lactone synthase [unclassified Bradyrhizobium]